MGIPISSIAHVAHIYNLRLDFSRIVVFPEMEAAHRDCGNSYIPDSGRLF